MMLNPLHQDVGNFRLLERKSVSVTGRPCFVALTVCLLLAAHVDGRPSPQDDGAVDAVDAVDAAKSQAVRRFKNADGAIRHEDHPVIYYKEDFVSEDFVPFKAMLNNTSSYQRHREYKDVSGRHHRRRRPLHRTKAEQYRALKPEKIYFDFLPEAPVVVPDESASVVGINKELTKIRGGEKTSPVTDVVRSENRGEESEDNKSKKPKKYSSRQRQRRDTSARLSHKRDKRVPSYRAPSDAYNNLLGLYQNLILTSQQAQLTHVRHPVKGVYYNTISWPGLTPERATGSIDFGTRFGDENETDRVVWRVKTAPTTRRPVPPLFHDSNPQNWDNSFLSASASRAPAAAATTTRRPVPPLFHDSNPNNWDTSFLTRRPVAQSPTTTRPNTNRLSGSGSGSGSGSSFTAAATESPETPPASPEISSCVWAIVNCCSGNNPQIRYSCFEANGCHGAFWDLNPCADDIFESAVGQVNEYLNSK